MIKKLLIVAILAIAKDDSFRTKLVWMKAFTDFTVAEDTYDLLKKALEIQNIENYETDEFIYEAVMKEAPLITNEDKRVEILDLIKDAVDQSVLPKIHSKNILKFSMK
jgi:hypothetical protein